MEWISVKDKMPENIKNRCEYDYVLVCSDLDKFDDFVVGIANRDNGTWKFMCCDVGTIVDCGMGIEDLSSEDITHWMIIERPRLSGAALTNKLMDDYEPILKRLADEE